MLALVVPAIGDRRLVVFEESVVQPAVPLAQVAGTPFSELRVALYASSNPGPDQLVLTTDKDASAFQGTGQIFAVGADQWFLRTASRQSLVGSLAGASPWLVLAGGLVTGALLVAFVDSLARRRGYALAIADERPIDLPEFLVVIDRVLDATSIRNVAADGPTNSVSRARR